MKKAITAILGIFLLSQSVNAQVIGGEHDKLFDLFLLEKYEDCGAKAFKMSEKDEYSRDAEVYLYLSMVSLKYLELDVSEEELEDRGIKPLKDALKYASKAVKYIERANDKEIPTISKSQNQDYFDKLAQKALDEALYFFHEDKASKCASTMKRLYKVEDDDPNITLLMAVSKLMSNNREGNMDMEKAMKELETAHNNGGYTPREATKTAINEAFVYYTRWLVSEGRSPEAKEFIAKGVKYLPENEEIKREYDKLN